LIIHRPGNLNTLPYFAGAKQRFADNDTPYMNIISGLQKLGENHYIKKFATVGEATFVCMQNLMKIIKTSTPKIDS